MPEAASTAHAIALAIINPMKLLETYRHGSKHLVIRVNPTMLYGHRWPNEAVSHNDN